MAYLANLRSGDHPVNFFTSHEYLMHKDVSWLEKDGLAGLWDGSTWFLPPLDADGVPVYDAEIWAGPQGVVTPGAEELDVEFIYHPQDFHSLEGSKWKVFRKNVRKWPERHEGPFVYRRLEEGEQAHEAMSLVLHWPRSESLFDPEVILRLTMYASHRFGLFQRGKLVGLNVADTNWRYINYRLCVDNGDPFMQEHLRHLFYTSEWVEQIGMPVNDGGALGREGLKQFKLKLNPVFIERVYTLHKQGERG